MSLKCALSRCPVVVLSPVLCAVLTFLLVFADIDISFSQPLEEMKRITEQKRKEEQRKKKEQAKNVKELYQDAVSLYKMKKYSKAKELFEKVKDSKVNLGFFDNASLKRRLKRIDKDIEGQKKERAALREAYDEGKRLMSVGDHEGAKRKFGEVLASEIELGDGLDEELEKNVLEVDKKLEESRKAAREEGKTARQVAREDVQGRAGRLEEAEGLLEKLREHKRVEEEKARKESEALYQLGKKLYIERDYVNALRKLEDALRKNPRHTEAKRLADETRGLVGLEPYLPKMLHQRLDEEQKVRIASDLAQVINTLRESEALIERGEYDDALTKLEASQRQLGFLELHQDVSAYSNKIDQMIREARAKKEQKKTQDTAERQKRALEEAAKEQTRLRYQQEDKISKLFEQALKQYQRGRYDQAIKIAESITKISPDNGPAQSLIETAKKDKVENRWKDLDQRDEDSHKELIQNIKKDTLPMSEHIEYPPVETWRKIKQREPVKLPSEKEAEEQARQNFDEALEQALEKKVSFNFNNTPLPDALEILKEQADVNLWISDEVRSRQDVLLNQKVNVPMKLKNALRHILPHDLDFAIKHEAIHVDTKKAFQAREPIVFRAYEVRDLLLQNTDFRGAESLDQNLPAGARNTPSPIGAKESPYNDRANERTMMAPEKDTSKRDDGIDSLQERSKWLVNFIVTLTGREKWKDSSVYGLKDEDTLLRGRGAQEFGGGGDNEEEEFGMGTVGIKDGDLLVQQTEDVHEMIEEIIKGLREKRYIQVGIEANFLDVTDEFLEEIGTSIPVFSYLFGGKPGESKHVLQNPPGVPGAATPIPPTAFVGTGAGASGIGNEGGNLEYDYLRNNQFKLLMKFVQTSNEADVLTSPRLTVFNAQRASLLVGGQEYFILTYQGQSAGTAGGAIGAGQAQALVPVIAQAPDSISLDVRPIVSADRKYVYLELQPAFNTLGGFTPFSFNVTIPTNNPADPFSTITYPIQLPTQQTLGVSTTVCVPDQGILVFGGLGTAEERNRESGPPILGKIPVINFFFSRHSKVRNRDYLIITIKPTIIISDELEAELE